MTPCSAASAITAAFASPLLRYSHGATYFRDCSRVDELDNLTNKVAPTAAREGKVYGQNNVGRVRILFTISLLVKFKMRIQAGLDLVEFRLQGWVNIIV